MVTDLARAFRAMDYPGERKAHASAVPWLGGVAIAAGVVAGAGTMSVLHVSDWGRRLHGHDLLALAVGTGMVVLVGLAEDAVRVAAWKRFLAEVLAATMLVSLGWEFTVLGLPWLPRTELGVLGPIVTVVWIVGVTNAINLVDGLDGLAAGVVGIIAASFLAVSLVRANIFSVLLMAAIVGARLGFLRYNWASARIFMGDSGSLTLGFLLAAVSVHTAGKATGAFVILVPILALGVPVMDTLLVMAGRFARRPGSPIKERVKGMFKADRSHLHHLLQAAQRRRQAVVKTVYALVAVTCVLALVVLVTKNAGFGLALAAFELAAIVAVRRLGWARAVAAEVEARREAVRAAALARAAGEPGEGEVQLPSADDWRGGAT